MKQNKGFRNSPSTKDAKVIQQRKGGLDGGAAGNPLQKKSQPEHYIKIISKCITDLNAKNKTIKP